LAIAPVLADIHTSSGRIKVAELIKKHTMSERKLERIFKKDVGVSIKAMTRLIRFTHAFRVIQNNVGKLSLSEIAYTTGYYDQTHLCNEIKTYTGYTFSVVSLRNSIMTVPEGSEESVWAMMQNGNVTIVFESIKSIEGRLPEISRQIGGSLLLYIKVQDINAIFESVKDQVIVIYDSRL
jgi:AraC-like DNA-binding protein